VLRLAGFERRVFERQLKAASEFLSAGKAAGKPPSEAGRTAKPPGAKSGPMRLYVTMFNIVVTK